MPAGDALDPTLPWTPFALDPPLWSIVPNKLSRSRSWMASIPGELEKKRGGLTRIGQKLPDHMCLSPGVAARVQERSFCAISVHHL